MTLAEYYKEKGKAEGKTEGKAEGQEEKTIEIILTCVKKGLEIELIAELTNCSVEEVEEVLKMSIRINVIGTFGHCSEL